MDVGKDCSGWLSVGGGRGTFGITGWSTCSLSVAYNTVPDNTIRNELT